MKWRNSLYPCPVFRATAKKITDPSICFDIDPSSMLLFNFLGYVCYFGCLFCLCMSSASHAWCQWFLSLVLNMVVLFGMRMCLFVWLSTTTQSRLLSMTIERRGGCGAGEPGYLAAFPASLCPGHLVVVIVSLWCRWTPVLDWLVVYHTNPMSIQRLVTKDTFCFSTVVWIVTVDILRLQLRHDQSFVRVRRASCCSHFKGGSMARTGF